MMACFSRWFTEVERYALQRAEKFLPCRPIAYSETESRPSEASSNDPEPEPPLP
jgi:hypothetical protein